MSRSLCFFLICLILPLLSCTREQKGTPEVERSLAALDAALGEKASFDEQKEARISAYREALWRARSDEERYSSSHDLFLEYSNYQFDSAYTYVQRMCSLAATEDQKALAECARVFCLISAGLYKEAFDALDAVSVRDVQPSTLLEYYRMQVRRML